MGRRTYVPVGNGRKGPRIKAGTSTVPLGDLPKVKRINIVGKVIHSASDAAQLFSVFRDPRIEIFNVAYFSRYGKVLAHTAWTCGLPSLSPSVYSYTLDDGFSKIQKTLEHLGASHIWIAHNHPTGNPNPSAQDEIVTENYRSYFKDKFAGHIILDHKEYSLYESDFFNNRSFETHTFKEPVKKLISKRLEDTVSASNPVDIARIFKKVFSSNEDVTAHAILDHKNRVVSWVYGGDNFSSELKEYMRAAGGTRVTTLTNNGLLYGKYCSRADQSLSTENNVLLDVILVNRWTGNYIKSHANDDFYRGATWQHFEEKKISYVVNSLSSKKEMDLNQPPARRDNNVKENTMASYPEKIALQHFLALTYLVDTEKIAKTAYINEIAAGRPYKPNEDKPKDKYDKFGSLIRYEEIFNLSEQSVAHEKMESFNKDKYDDALLSLLWKRDNLIKKNTMSDSIDSEREAMIKQGLDQPSARQDTNIKENTMSDENIPNAEHSPSSEEAAFQHALNQRSKVTQGLKNGTLSCLPGADGFADTQPAFNIMTGKIYHGANLLFLKDHQKQLGFPTGEYITAYQISNASKDNPDIAIKPGEKSVILHFSEKNEDTGIYEKKNVQLYNIAQVTTPLALKHWVLEQEYSKIDRMSVQFGESFNPLEYRSVQYNEREPGPVITCKSTDPEKYLGQYFAAVSMGGKFQASPEQANEFSQKLEASLYEKMENGHTNPFKLSKISIDASQHCKEVIREIKTGHAITPEQKQEQKQEQSLGRGR